MQFTSRGVRVELLIKHEAKPSAISRNETVSNIYCSYYTLQL